MSLGEGDERNTGLRPFGGQNVYQRLPVVADGPPAECSWWQRQAAGGILHGQQAGPEPRIGASTTICQPRHDRASSISLNQ